MREKKNKLKIYIKNTHFKWHIKTFKHIAIKYINQIKWNQNYYLKQAKQIKFILYIVYWQVVAIIMFAFKNGLQNIYNFPYFELNESPSVFHP